MMRTLFLFLALIVSLPARAQVTITNFAGGTASANQLSQYDQAFNKVDSHSLSILQVGSTFYRYGETYGCGFIWKTVSPYCGVRVYASSDLVHWQPLGLLFDPTTTYWQQHCNGTSSGGGCFRPRMLYNAANHDYVLWLNQYNDTTTSVAAELVVTCTTPGGAADGGSCTSAPDPTHIVHGPIGDAGLTVDSSGNGWISYSYLTTREIYMEELNSAYTDTLGVAYDTGANGEGDAPVFIGSNVYVTFGALCAYCSAGVATQYVSATTPSAAWSAAATLNSNSCNGQPNAVYAVAGNYLFTADQWDGLNNEAMANIYWQPLTLTGAAINAYTCSATVSLQGLSPAPYPSPYFATDQGGASGTFADGSNPANYQLLQTFSPTQASLSYVLLALGQAGSFNGNVTISIVTLDASNNPVSTVASVSLAPSQLSWATQWVLVPISATLTPATAYGIKLSTAATTGSFAFAASPTGATSPYPSGLLRYSTDGVTWTTLTGRALMFATVPGAVRLTGGLGLQLLGGQMVVH